MSCSKDDNPDPVVTYKNEVEIVNHEWKRIETSGDMVRVSINATVKNETKEDQRGRLVVIRYRDNTDPNDRNLWLFSEVFEIKKGETVNFSQDMPDYIKLSIFNNGYNEILFELEKNIMD